MAITFDEYGTNNGTIRKWVTEFLNHSKVIDDKLFFEKLDSYRNLFSATPAKRNPWRINKAMKEFTAHMYIGWTEYRENDKVLNKLHTACSTAISELEKHKPYLAKRMGLDPNNDKKLTAENKNLYLSVLEQITVSGKSHNAMPIKKNIDSFTEEMVHGHFCYFKGM